MFTLSLGSLFEVYSPSGFYSALLIYQLAMVFGGLGYSYIWPYRGLIGCSPGVYGLIGACWVLVIFHRNKLDHFIAFILPFLLVTQLLGDV